MEVGYREAMEQLESMFEKFDRETIQAVLASNEGHLERTIEDLMKLTEEVENAPDDDNLFADTDSRPGYPSRMSAGGYSGGSGVRSTQESEDAKLAYELQMQEIRNEQNQQQAGSHGSRHGGNQYGTNEYVSNQHGSNQYGSNQYGGNQYGGSQSTGMSAEQRKKNTFYKKVKVGLNNLFKRKGKGGAKGPTRNPGVYAEIDANEGNGNGLLDEDDNEAPMQLADVLGGGGNRGNDDDDSPASPYNHNNNRGNNMMGYGGNRNAHINQMHFNDDDH